MARSPRIFFPGAIYHVYCRTARGEMVFSDPLEAHAFVDTVADVKRLHGFLVAKLVAKHPGSVSRWLETSRCVADRQRVQALIEDLCDRLSRKCELDATPPGCDVVISGTHPHPSQRRWLARRAYVKSGRHRSRATAFKNSWRNLTPKPWSPCGSSNHPRVSENQFSLSAWRRVISSGRPCSAAASRRAWTRWTTVECATEKPVYDPHIRSHRWMPIVAVEGC